MRRFDCSLVLAAFIAVCTLIVACGGGTDPKTWTNLFGLNDTPLKIEGVVVDLEASQVRVRTSPRDSSDKYVELDGWFFLPDDTSHANQLGINFTRSPISSQDTKSGWTYFTVVSYNWPSSWNGNKLTPGIQYFFQVAASLGSQTRVGVWKSLNGTTTHIARAEDGTEYNGIHIGLDILGPSGEWRAMSRTQRLELVRRMVLSHG